MNPALGDPIRHHRVGSQRCRDGGSLKVLCLSCGVLGDGGGSDVEPGQSRQAAQDEEAEEEVVDWCAEAHGEGG